MKKILLPFIGFSILFLGSCKKCLTCSYTYTDTATGQSVTTQVGSQCGKEPDLSALETDCQNAAQSVNGTCECYQ